eukprot:1157220-Pelagomonas_calceolata.AAC.7
MKDSLPTSLSLPDLRANCMMEWLREESEFAAVVPTLRCWLALSISCFTIPTSSTLYSFKPTTHTWEREHQTQVASSTGCMHAHKTTTSHRRLPEVLPAGCGNGDGHQQHIKLYAVPLTTVIPKTVSKLQHLNCSKIKSVMPWVPKHTKECCKGGMEHGFLFCNLPERDLGKCMPSRCPIWVFRGLPRISPRGPKPTVDSMLWPDLSTLSHRAAAPQAIINDISPFNYACSTDTKAPRTCLPQV